MADNNNKMDILDFGDGDVADKGCIVELFSFDPKIFTCFFALSFRIRSEKDILKLVQTIIANTKGEGEGIVFHGLFEVNGI